MTRPWYNHPPEQGLPMLRRGLKRVLSRPAAVLMALLTVLGVGFATAAPASAYDLPPDANGIKFWSPNICIEPGAGIPDAIASQTSYRLAYIAQQWNLKTSILALDYSTDCAADGYPPSRRMVVGLFNNPDYATCLYSVNTQTDISYGMHRWTNGPGVYMNVARTGCVGTQTRRDHIVSVAIGQKLGLALLDSTGYNSRVMNGTVYSWDNVPLPDQNSGNTLDAIYSYMYCQPFGNAC